MSDTVLLTVSDSTNNLLNNTTQEVNDLGAFLQLEVRKYYQHKILYNIINEEIIKKNSCEDPLKTKVLRKLMKKSCLQCSDIGNIGEGNLLFLRIDEKEAELSFSESNQLQTIINSKLKTKYKDICEGVRQITGYNICDVFGNMKSSPLLELRSEDKILISFKEQLNSISSSYMKNLLVHLELLDEITKLRINSVPFITQQKIKVSELRSRINVLRSRIAQEKVRVDIFTETDKSLAAFNILIGDIKHQKEETKKEIEELQEMKEKYNTLSCKQFDEILKTFLQYKSSIEKKKLLYSYINS